jgi:hypothetical protein
LSLWALVLCMYRSSKPEGSLSLFLVLSVMTMAAMCYTLRKLIKCQEKLKREY